MLTHGLAARWAAEHPDLLPIDSREIAPPLLEKTEILESNSWSAPIVLS